MLADSTAIQNHNRTISSVVLADCLVSMTDRFTTPGFTRKSLIFLMQEEPSSASSQSEESDTNDGGSTANCTTLYAPANLLERHSAVDDVRMLRTNVFRRKRRNYISLNLNRGWLVGGHLNALYS